MPAAQPAGGSAGVETQPAATPQPSVQPAGGPPADVATLVGQVQQLTTQVQGLVAQLQAQQGAGQIQPQQPTPAGPAGPSASGGGPAQATAGAAGCGCGGMATPGQVPGQAPPPPPGSEPPAPPPGAEPGQGHPADEGGVRSRIVRLAQGEVGVVEAGGEDRGERIVTYRKAVTGAGEKADLPEPWCADFVSWVFREAGIPIGRGGKGEDYVPYLKDWAQGAGRYHARGSYEPKPGDIVVFNWDGGRDDHVGIVEKVEGGKIHTIEGNSSNGVRRKSYALTDGQVTGYVSAT